MQHIGRFKILEKLGEGAQGSVWLCRDPDLQREVAIKVLDRSIVGTSVAEQDFLIEARAISRIQHPNIVSIYDVGKQGGRPYLVFEYVEGELLSHRLASGLISIHTSLDILEGLLMGLDQVHQQKIVHRDLKPSNIILGQGGVPKIMDFGISHALSVDLNSDGIRAGTPRYMAPEYIQKGVLGTAADIFALGAIFYELLSGKKAFNGNNQKDLLRAVCESSPLAPSSLKDEVSERLDALVFKALEKNPETRYTNADEMLTALQTYRDSERIKRDENGGGKDTVEFMLRRMQHKSDFPALSESIRTLNSLASDDVDVSQLASVITRDFSLSTKILKVVNSAYYSRYGGNISTISRAIVVLGIKPIRSIAASLIFFDHLHNKAQSKRLKNEIAAAIFGAALARQAAEDAAMDEVEESFLCALLHNLGRILVAYYLNDESEEVERLVQQEGMNPEQAQHRVLGMSYQQVGIAIAKQWNFPAVITRSMVYVDPKTPGNLRNPDIKLQLLASFSSEAAMVIGENAVDDPKPVKNLLKKYRMTLAISGPRFEKMTGEARKSFRDLTTTLGDGQTASPFMKRLVTAPDPEVLPVKKATGKPDITASLTLVAEADKGRVTVPADPETSKPSPDAEVILSEGLQEVSTMLLDERIDLTQVFNVVLETIYRAMAFNHVVLSLQDINRREYSAKLGFGADIDEFMSEFHFPVAYSANVFHAALKKGADLYIADTRDHRIKDDLPAWYKKISSAGSFILFPMVVKSRPLGFIYADHPRPKGMDLSGRQLNLLKSLRNQVVLAFRARS
ncbi:MAG: HDOD domain-containing protein [Gammaproteobacteria bacterium]|nr:HDOD domain-containing protein [Gammaproteobacteria bacterium]